jgi:tetrahydromethanopterin S-methyltransferase subunit G
MPEPAIASGTVTAAMGWFTKRDPDEIERLRAEVASMAAQLQASEQSKVELAGRVAGIAERLDTPLPAPPEPAPAAPSVDPAEIDKLNARLQRLGDRVDGVAGVDPAELEQIDGTLRRLTERLDELDGRITSISTELANQITELSGEIESAGGREPATDDVVDELRDAQTRLAAEQARYQIAFRQDLADLADRLRRA